MLGGDFSVALDTLTNLGRGDDPSGTGSGGEDLGEGVEADDTTVGINGEKGGNKGGDEFLGGKLSLLLLRGDSVGVHLKEVVRLVLNDDEVVLLSDLVNLLAALGTLGCTSGVLARRDGVHQERLAGSTGFDIPGGEKGVQSRGDHSFIVHGYTDEAASKRVGSLDGGGEGVLLRDDVVAALEEHTVDHVQRGGRTGGQSASPVTVGRVVDNLGVLGDPAEELGGSGGLTVVQGNPEVVGRLAVTDVVLADMHNLAGDFGFGLGELAESGDLDVEGLEGEVFSERETSTEGDHTWDP